MLYSSYAKFDSKKGFKELSHIPRIIPSLKNSTKSQDLYQKLFPSCGVKCRRRSEKFRWIQNVQFRGHVAGCQIRMRMTIGCEMPDASIVVLGNVSIVIRKIFAGSVRLISPSWLSSSRTTPVTTIVPGEVSTTNGTMFLWSERLISRSCRRLTCRMCPSSYRLKVV